MTYELRCEKIALCIAAFRVAALWCTKNTNNLGGRFGYFLFFCSGEGKREFEAPGKGGVGFFFFFEIPEGGGGWFSGGGGLRDREGVCGQLGGGT